MASETFYHSIALKLPGIIDYYRYHSIALKLPGIIDYFCSFTIIAVCLQPNINKESASEHFFETPRRNLLRACRSSIGNTQEGVKNWKEVVTKRFTHYARETY